MTPDEIKQLVAEQVAAQMADGLKTGLDSFRAHFDNTLVPFTSRLAEIEGFLTEPDTATESGVSPSTEPNNDMTNAAYKALQKRLEEMERKDSERETSAKAGRFKDELRKAISPENPLHSSLVEELLSTRYGNLIEAEGTFISDKGEKLSELVQAFFTTAEGSHFKPAKSKPGTGEVTTTTAEPKPGKATPTLDEMLRNMSL